LDASEVTIEAIATSTTLLGKQFHSQQTVAEAKCIHIQSYLIDEFARLYKPITLLLLLLLLLEKGARVLGGTVGY